MQTITRSGDFYTNASSATLRVTFKVARIAGKGSFKFIFDAPGRKQNVTMPSRADVYILTGDVESNGEVSVNLVGNDDQLSVKVVDVTEVG